MSDHVLFDHDDAPSSSERDDDDSDSSDEYDDDQPDHDGYPANYQPRNADNEGDRKRILDMQNPTGPSETVEPDDLYAEQPITKEPVHRYSTRSRGEATTIHGPYKEGRRWVNSAPRKRRRLQC